MITESQVKSAMRLAQAEADKQKAMPPAERSAAPPWMTERKDDAARGAGRLGLRVRSVRGRVIAEWYATYYRSERRKLAKLGTYPAMSLTDARSVFRQSYMPAIAAGAEPKTAAHLYRKGKNPASVEELFQAYVADLRRARKRSADAVERVLLSETSGAARSIGPDRAAAAVTPSDIVAVLQPIYARGAVVMASQIRAYLVAAFNFGLQSSYDYRASKAAVPWALTSNPAAAVKSDDQACRTSNRFLAPIEVRAYWEWLTAARLSGSGYARAAQIHLATGQRVEEILRMTSRCLDRSMGMYHWDRTKKATADDLRPHSIPLPKIAIDLLDEAEPNDHGLYFPHRDTPEQPAPYNRVGDLITAYIAETGAAWFCARDIRRTWKTLAGRAGVTKEMRDKLQNHRRGGDVGSKHYDRYDYLAEKRAAMAKWEAFLSRILAGELDDDRVAAEVVSIAAAAA